MLRKTIYPVLMVGLLLSMLAGCQAAPQATEPAPTETPIPPSSTPAPSNTPEPTATLVPTETPIPPTATITLSPAEPIASIDDITGVWLGYWSDINMLNLEFTNFKRMTVSFSRDNSMIARSYFTIENGLLTFTTVDGPAIASACQANPVATYRVSITRRGDQPVSLYFELVGEDACVDRVDLFDGDTLTWIEP